MAGTETTSAVEERTAIPGHESLDSSMPDIQSLTEAFGVFNEKTRNLQNSYSSLKKQVEQVNEELKLKNEALKRKIEELDMTRDYLNNIVESMSSGLIAVNMRERITTFNKAAERITGYSRRELLGKRYSTAFPEAIGEQSILGRMIERPNSRVLEELTLSTKKGDSIPIGASLSPVRDAENRLMGAIQMFNDLTEIKLLEEQVRRADRLAALGEMAASVAHEIRNPLGGIEGFASLLERDLAGDESKRAMARNIVDGAKILNRIVSSLLDFTRPLSLIAAETKVEEVIEEALTLAVQKPGQMTDKLVVEKRFHADGVLRIDRQLMLQVFMNLILNAVQAMDGEGVLSLETQRVNGAFHIHIGDTGCGIPNEVRERLFMPFVTTKREGNGLGLSMVMKIVSAHNGTIKYESKCGEGTVFNITLPATTTEQA